MKFEGWFLIDDDGQDDDGNTYVSKVIGGWLIKAYDCYKGGISIVFLLDPKHKMKWKG